METNFENNDIPWALIAAALQGELTSEDKLLFESWLIQSPENRDRYERLELVWKEGVADYPRYLAADETRAWSEMQARLDPGAAPLKGAGDRVGAGAVRRIGVWRWAAVAAALVILVGGAELWRASQLGNAVRYATVAGEVKAITLDDGTTITMEPGTRIQVAGGYNRKARTVVMLAGSAAFAVVHKEDQPFSVVMDGASIRDIGTRFMVTKTADSIAVSVTEGKVAFTNKVTGESRELTAGSSVLQLMTPGHEGEIKTNELRFNNAKLSDVIAAVQERYGKKVALADSALGKKRLTIHLDGESFDDAVKVICVSLNLESQADSNGYILKDRATK